MPRNAKFREKNKMSSNVKFCKKNKVLINAETNTAKTSILDNGYKIEVDEKSYLLFEKEEDYLFLVYLERIIFDLFKNIRFQKEEKEVRVLFRFTLIEKCLENLKEILLESFYNKNESKNPFKIRFPHLWYMKNYIYASRKYDIVEDSHYWEDLDEMGEVLYPELCFFVHYDDETNIAFYQDGYGNCFEGGSLERVYDCKGSLERGYHCKLKYKGKEELSKEQKIFQELEKRRLLIFSEKFRDLEMKIRHSLNIKKYKV